MHEIEPFYNWRHLYNAEEDEQSPFYGVEHSEFEFSNTVYNYYIHPQWDEFGSRTLYLKVLFVDYELNYTIIELIGEWNDAVENDIMQLKRSVADLLVAQGIHKFILIAENVLNFHSSDTDYYEEWNDDIKDNGGWIAAINMPEQTQYDFHRSHIDRYVYLLESPNWRTFQPHDFFQSIDNQILRLQELQPNIPQDYIPESFLNFSSCKVPNLMGYLSFRPYENYHAILIFTGHFLRFRHCFLLRRTNKQCAVFYRGSQPGPNGLPKPIHYYCHLITGYK